MSTLGIILLGLGAFYLGFFTAALMAAAGRADESTAKQPLPVDKQSLTTHPPFNFCGEQAIGGCIHCGGYTDETGSWECADCKAKARGK